MPYLLAFARRTDRDPHAQAGAIFFLVRIAPEKAEVVDAIQDLLGRKMDHSARVDTLNALGAWLLRDVHVIDTVIGFLDDPDQGVRFTAAQTLRGMGEHAVLQAEPALRKVVSRAGESAEVTTAAKEALETISPTR